MNLGDRVTCGVLTPTNVGLADRKVNSVITTTLEADTVKLGGTDLQSTLTTLAGNSETADWNGITNKPSNLVDWTTDQGDTNIDANNYVNTTYAVASNGTPGLTHFDFSSARKDKLAGIAEGAQVNVQTDWNATSGTAQILNKPTWIPAANPNYLTNASLNNPTVQSLTSTGALGWDAPIHVSTSFEYFTVAQIKGEFETSGNGGKLTFHTKANNGVLGERLKLTDAGAELVGSLTTTGSITGNVTGDVTGTVSSLANHDTDDISEGSSNLYYTNDRVKNFVNTHANFGPLSISTLTTSSQITSQAGVVNAFTHLGNFTIGNVRNQTNNEQGICHRNWIGWNRFALMQNNSGNTNINGWSNVSLRVQWGSRLYVDQYNVWVQRTMLPDNNAGRDLGSSSRRWRNIYAWNSVIQTSDDRHKINERPIDNALGLLQQLNLYEYEKVKTMNGTDVTETERGVLAQDVLNTELAYAVSGGGTEEVTHRDDDENVTKETVDVAYSVRYNDIFVTALQAIKDLSTQVDDLQSRLTALE